MSSARKAYKVEATPRFNGNAKEGAPLEGNKVATLLGAPLRVRVRVEDGNVSKIAETHVHVQENVSSGNDINGEPGKQK